MITYPSLPTFPTIEAGGADAIANMLRGTLSPRAAADLIQRVATDALWHVKPGVSMPALRSEPADPSTRPTKQ